MFKKIIEEKKEKTLLEKMQESRDQHGVAYICVFNNREVLMDEKCMTGSLKYAQNPISFDGIEEVLYNVNESYSRNYEFDTLDLDLRLGLIYNGKYVDEEKHLKEEAEPLEGVVRYYTMGASCYLDGEKTNRIDMGEIRGRQGFIDYKLLIKSIEQNGLTFNGPRTFKEFKEQILIGEPFDISVRASFSTKEKETQPVKVKQKEVDR